MYLLILTTFLLFFTPACSHYTSISPQQKDVYSALFEKDTEKARNLLKTEKDNYINTFLLACLELSEGNLDAAKEYARQLVDKYKDFPDGKVLLKLIERRQYRAEERWLSSFGFAWQAAGSPNLIFLDLISGDLLGERWLEEKPCEDWKVSATVSGTPNEVLWAFEKGLTCNREKFLRLCLDYTNPETPTEIKLFVFQHLDFYNNCTELLNDSESDYFKISEDLCAKVREQREELLKQLSRELSDYSAFAVRAILENISDKDTLSLDEVKGIEEAIARPHLYPLTSELYDFYLMKYREIDTGNPYIHALTTAYHSYDLLFFSDLSGKVTATAQKASPELKQRLWMILDKVGNAHMKRPTLIDHLVGNSLLSSSAEIKSDKKKKEEMREMHEFIYELTSNNNFSASFASIYWPIYPLMIDSIDYRVRDEIGAYLLLTGLKRPRVLEKYYDSSEKTKR